MSNRIPQLDDVRPDWQAIRAELDSAERDVAKLPRGSEERRIASKRASAILKLWRQILSDLRRARRDAGWVMTSDRAWVYSPKCAVCTHTWWQHQHDGPCLASFCRVPCPCSGFAQALRLADKLQVKP